MHIYSTLITLQLDELLGMISFIDLLKILFSMLDHRGQVIMQINGFYMCHGMDINIGK